MPPGTHYSVFADAPSADLASAAAAAWQTTGVVTLDVFQAPCPESGQGIICVRQTALGPDEGGLTVRTDGTDSSDVSVIAGMPLAVYEHELGHAMALEHTGPGTVMCPGTGCMSPGVTATDVDQFLSLR